jgi:hypothetical protein
MDVIGLPPDTFDEMEFYAAIFDYIANYDRLYSTVYFYKNPSPYSGGGFF